MSFIAHVNDFVNDEVGGMEVSKLVGENVDIHQKLVTLGETLDRRNLVGVETLQVELEGMYAVVGKKDRLFLLLPTFVRRFKEAGSAADDIRVYQELFSALTD